MKTKSASRLAWSVGIVAIALTLGQLVVMFIDRNVALPNTTSHLVHDLELRGRAQQLVNMAATGFGILLASRQPRNPIGWLFLAAGFVLGVSGSGSRLRAPRPGGGPRLVAGGTGRRVAVQLDGADPARRALLPLPPVPDRSSSVGEVATGSVVRGRRLHARHGVLPRLLDHVVEPPVPSVLFRRLIGVLVVDAPSPADRLLPRGIPRWRWSCGSGGRPERNGCS